MQSLMTEEKLKLKRVTGGKYHRSSLVFHFEKDDLNHEFQIKRIHSNSLNLRLVQPLRKYLKNRQMYTTFIIQMWSYCYFGIQRLRTKLCPECRTDLGSKNSSVSFLRFHSSKPVQSTDGLEKGRLHLKRRRTILRETDIFDILTKYES